MKISPNKELKNLKSSNLLGLYTIFSTLIIFICGLCTFDISSFQFIIWPFGFTLTTLCLVRFLMLSHDIGHKILFSSNYLNNVCKIMVTSITGLPIVFWSRGHHVHHRYNGNLSIYKGPLVIISIQEFLRLSLKTRKVYTQSRNLFNIYIASVLRYLIIPRLRLIPRFNINIIGINSVYRYNLFGAIILASQQLHVNKGEVIDTLIATFGFIVFLWSLSSFSIHILVVFLISLSFSYFITDIVFHIQHNFNGSYACTKQIWSYDRAIFEGTANISFPFYINWFMANIGYHQAHHLWPHLPFYHLKYADSMIPSSQKYNNLNLSDIGSCLRLITWDIIESTYVAANHK